MDDITLLIMMGLCGLLFIYLGYLIWIKEKINLIHDYHYAKVKKEDRKVYTSLMGKAVIVMGLGMILSGILYLIIHTGICGIAFAVCFLVGLLMMLYTQMKYNHGLF